MGGCSKASRDRNWAKKNPDSMEFSITHFKQELFTQRNKHRLITIEIILIILKKYSFFKNVNESSLKSCIKEYLELFEKETTNIPKFPTLMGELYSHTLKEDTIISGQYNWCGRCLAKVIYTMNK
jgi:hypothetical protein